MPFVLLYSDIVLYFCQLLVVSFIYNQKRKWEHEKDVKGLKIDTQAEEIQHLAHRNENLFAEVQAFREKEEYHRELLSDLSAELSLTASRESKANQDVEKLQFENRQLQEQHSSEEITISSLEQREKSISFEIDDLQKELQEAAVREAQLLCEIAEAHGERDALKEQYDRAMENLGHFGLGRDEPLPGKPLDITALLPPSVQALGRVHEDDDEATNTNEGRTQCPVQ